MLQSRIASKGSMSYYIFRERLTEGKKSSSEPCAWVYKLSHGSLRPVSAGGSSAPAPKPGLQHMIGTSMCWHKSPWIIQIHNTPLSQTKRTCPSQYYQTSCEPSSEGHGTDSTAWAFLQLVGQGSTGRKFLQRPYCRHQSTGSLCPKSSCTSIWAVGY